MRQHMLTLDRFYNLAADAFRVDPIGAIMILACLILTWWIAGVLARIIHALLTSETRYLTTRPETGRHAIADRPTSIAPTLSRKALARVARRLVEIAEILAPDADAQADDSPEGTEIDDVEKRLQMVADLKAEFENRPGFHSLHYDFADPRRIKIVSSDHDWKRAVQRWIADRDVAMDIDFEYPAPTKKPVKVPRRCPHCQSLQVIPKFDGSSHAFDWQCQKCGFVFARTVLDSARRDAKPDEATGPKSVAQSPSMPMNVSDAIDRMMQSDAPDANHSIYSGPTRDPQ